MPYKDKEKQKRVVRQHMRDRRELLKIVKRDFPQVYEEAHKRLQKRKRGKQ